MEAFQTEFNAQTAAVQGSGWGWLAWDAKANDLTIVACANQDPCRYALFLFFFTSLLLCFVLGFLVCFCVFVIPN
jgi:superoxide dismutase